MAGSVNKVILVGNLGADPEVRALQNGNKVANLRIATSESWKDKNTGERREKTEWHRVNVWGDWLVGIVEKYLHKGSKVYLEGKLQTRKWTNQDGKDQFSTEIVIQGFDGSLTLLDGNRGGQGGDNAAGAQGIRQDGTGSQGIRRDGTGSRGGGSSQGAIDDEIPF